MISSVKCDNENRLKVLGVPFNPHLPLIEKQSELTPRTALEVSSRACVLSHVIGVGFGRSGSEMLKALERIGLSDELTPRELKLLQQVNYSDHDRAWAAWQFASVHACGWALGIEPLEPLGPCSDSLASHFPFNRRPEPNAILRPHDELYREADFYYRLHWAARQLQFEGGNLALSETEIRFRRHGLDWIIGLPYAWDDIPHDT
jgi:Domain of unknown function (DUF4272)